MLISQPDLELLPAVSVLLRPFRVVFLHNLAIFDDALDLRDHEGADTHCALSDMGMNSMILFRRTLLPDQRVVSVIGVVRVTRRGTPAIAQGSKVEF